MSSWNSCTQTSWPIRLVACNGVSTSPLFRACSCSIVWWRHFRLFFSEPFLYVSWGCCFYEFGLSQLKFTWLRFGLALFGYGRHSSLLWTQSTKFTTNSMGHEEIVGFSRLNAKSKRWSQRWLYNVQFHRTPSCRSAGTLTRLRSISISMTKVHAEGAKGRCKFNLNNVNLSSTIRWESSWSSKLD